MEFLGDDFYKRKRERAIADGTAGALDSAIDLGSQAATSVGDFVSGLTSAFWDTLTRASEVSRRYADSAAAAARGTARAAADAAAGAARSTYEVRAC